MKRFLLPILPSILMVCAPSLFAQFDRGGAMTYEGKHKHSFYLETPFRAADFAIGGTYRYSINSEKFLGITASFFGRPFGKSILVQHGRRTYFQWKEYRYVLAAGLDKKFWLNNRWDAFISASAGYTFADYRGSGEGTFMGMNLETKDGITPVINVGLSYKFSRFVFLRGGFQYTDLKTVRGVRIYAGLGGQL